MKLGAFSISLNVKDLTISKEFYEKLGFKVFGGDMAMNYVIMKNGDALIGLFQGMFENNIITFNPGWNQDANQLEIFNDVREIRDSIIAKGINPAQETLEEESGPGSIILTDPDGNMILIDQHIE